MKYCLKVRICAIVAKTSLAKVHHDSVFLWQVLLLPFLPFTAKHLTGICGTDGHIDQVKNLYCLMFPICLPCWTGGIYFQISGKSSFNNNSERQMTHICQAHSGTRSYWNYSRNGQERERFFHRWPLRCRCWDHCQYNTLENTLPHELTSISILIVNYQYCPTLLSYLTTVRYLLLLP